MNGYSLKDKSALVTGANRGIGKAFVEYLIESGVSKVYAASRDVAQLEALCAQYPEVIVPLLLDVTNPAHMATLPEKVDHLDILINNAGIASACISTSTNTLTTARAEMETNFFGPMQVTFALLPLLKQAKNGVIINISSIAGISNFPALGPYSTTKAALHSFTQGLRADLHEQGIQVLGVYPGPIDTRMTESMEMDKTRPEQVAIATFAALAEGEHDVFPDPFSQQMYANFLEHPRKLEQTFAEM